MKKLMIMIGLAAAICGCHAATLFVTTGTNGAVVSPSRFWAANSNEINAVVRAGSGTNGAPGLNGTNGYTPIKGVDYFDGTNGAPGLNGTNGAAATSSYIYLSGASNSIGTNFDMVILYNAAGSTNYLPLAASCTNKILRIVNQEADGKIVLVPHTVGVECIDYGYESGLASLTLSNAIPGLPYPSYTLQAQNIVGQNDWVVIDTGQLPTPAGGGGGGTTEGGTITNMVHAQQDYYPVLRMYDGTSTNHFIDVGKSNQCIWFFITNTPANVYNFNTTNHAGASNGVCFTKLRIFTPPNVAVPVNFFTNADFVGTPAPMSIPSNQTAFRVNIELWDTNYGATSVVVNAAQQWR